MLRRVQKYIRDNELLQKGDRVLVCVSGGADSIALWDVLQRGGYECIIAHCNFHLRNEEINRDEEFVRELATGHGLLAIDKEQLDMNRIPQHIAIIMDGNGRWATSRGLPREMGHKSGAEAFRRIVEYCIDLDIELVTVYAFSTENWKRPQSEVDGIMKLLTCINNEKGTAIVMVTHNRQIFEKYQGRVMVCRDETCIEQKDENITDLELTI